jgi:hypothetical protein
MTASADGQPTEPPPKRARWKRWLMWAIVLLVVAIGCAALVVKDHVRTLWSLRRVPNTNLYVMDYYGSYHMDEIRTHGINLADPGESCLAALVPDIVLPLARWAREAYEPETIETVPDAPPDHCSTAVVRTADGKVLFGRNFDWKHDACLILKVHGGDAMSSVAVIDIAYLGLDRADLDKTSLWERVPLLFAPYYLEDGMNQYGVAVSEMYMPDAKTPCDAAKPHITSGTVLRLIVDHAKSTDEAIAILKDYNVHFGEVPVHLLIADATGDSAVVEFIDGDVKVTRTGENWQVCTNHRIWGKTEEENDESCQRYRTLSDWLAELGGMAAPPDVMNIMALAAAKNGTMWTSVYDLTTGEFRVAYRRQFADAYSDHLGRE